LREDVSRAPKDGKALDFDGEASLWPSVVLSHYINSIEFCDSRPASLSNNSSLS
jgi:hypothetical protein